MSVNCGEEAQEETLARSVDLEDLRSSKSLDHRFVSGAPVASRRVSGMVCGEGGMMINYGIFKGLFSSFLREENNE